MDLTNEGVARESWSSSRLPRPPARTITAEELAARKVALLTSIARHAKPERSTTRRAFALGVAFGAASLFAVGAGASNSGHVLRIFGLESPSSAEITHAIRSDWEDTIAARAIAEPHQEFPNPPQRVLFERASDAAERFGFSVVSITVHRPRGEAPDIVIKTDTPGRLADRIPEIRDMLDPKQRGDDGSGWTYEGFFLEARDARHEPFLVIFNFWRGDDGGGGQWARSDALYPFGHSEPFFKDGGGQ